MPRGMTLYLLDAQPEHFPQLFGALIMSNAHAYRHSAQAAQRALADHPDLEHLREYAFALRRWAKETKNRKAVRFANALLALDRYEDVRNIAGVCPMETIA